MKLAGQENLNENIHTILHLERSRFSFLKFLLFRRNDRRGSRVGKRAKNSFNTEQHGVVVDIFT
jgi:hypothetical protein